MRKILFVFLMVFCFANVGYGQNTVLERNTLLEFNRDRRGMKAPPLVVYNPVTRDYEAIYFTADSNGYFNVTIASGTVGVAIAGIVPVSQSGVWNIGTLTSITNPVAVTGAFWQATQPVSLAAGVDSQLRLWDGVAWQNGLAESAANPNLRTRLYGAGNPVYVDDIDVDTVINSQNALGAMAFGYAYEPVTQRWARNRCNASFHQIVDNTNYTGNTSTGTSGKLNSAGVIPGTAFEVDARTYYVLGGDAELTESWRNGTVYLFEDQPWQQPRMEIPEASPTITVTSLDAGATFYYDLDGVE